MELEPISFAKMFDQMRQQSNMAVRVILSDPLCPGFVGQFTGVDMCVLDQLTLPTEIDPDLAWNRLFPLDDVASLIDLAPRRHIFAVS